MKDNVKILYSKEFEMATNGEITHFVTTRHSGFSTGKYESLNLGAWCGDNKQNVEKNKELLCNKLNIEVENLLVPREVHNDKSVEIDNSFFEKTEIQRQEALSQADALTTQKRGVAISVSTADCVPVLAYDKESRTAFAIHAGWRGIVSEIVKKTISEAITGNRNKLFFLICPCIGADNYEVEDDVWSRFKSVFSENEQKLILKKRTATKFYPDLRKAVRIQLERLVPGQNILDIDQNTYTSEDLFSVRRDGQQTGRFLSGIIIN